MPRIPSPNWSIIRANAAAKTKVGGCGGIYHGGGHPHVAVGCLYLFLEAKGCKVLAKVEQTVKKNSGALAYWGVVKTIGTEEWGT